MAEPLATYINRTHAALSIAPPSLTIFPSPEPALSHTSTNTILYFPGAFNPPHTGHGQMLSAALNHSSQTPAPIAALVGPRDDTFVSDKVAIAIMDKTPPSREIWLSCQDRAALWAGTQKTWAIATESREEFFQYLLKLRELIMAGGYEVEFAMVVGAEYVQADEAWRNRLGSGVELGIVCSNATRAAGFEDDGGKLKPLTWCGEWRLVDEVDEGEDKVKTWACTIDDSLKELTYVQFQRPASERGGTSATDVRRMTIDGKKVEEEPLKSLVLRPDLLAAMTWKVVER